MKSDHNEQMAYLDKLEKLCEFLESCKYKSSYDAFEKVGIITRNELSDERFRDLRRDVVFWNSGHRWSRRKDWKHQLKLKRSGITLTRVK